MKRKNVPEKWISSKYTEVYYNFLSKLEENLRDMNFGECTNWQLERHKDIKKKKGKKN